MSDTEATGKPTPFAGCTIFIVIIAIITFCAIFSWKQYREYKAAIISISQLEKTTLPVTSFTNASAQPLIQKIAHFEKQVKAGEKTTIRFSADELNLAIAYYPKLQPFRGEMYISKITSKGIVAQIAYQVRAGFDGFRYLNGTMTMQPQIAMGSIFPVVSNISAATGNPVPPKMSREFPTLMFSEYRNDKTLAEVFHKLSTVTLEGNQMIILSDPSIKQPDSIPDDVSDETERALWVFGLLVFMFVTTVAFILWYKKRRQA